MTAGATSLARPLSDRMRAARDLPNGARFYRCALQVNPFGYLDRYRKATAFSSEDNYNKAIIATCRETGIEVIAVTDHYRVRDSAGLVRAARGAGLHAFSGFEAVTKDGVHLLCLFDPDKDDVLERYIGECGIHDPDQPSPTGSKDCIELLACAKDWGAVCIAAHVASGGGLLKNLSGQPRVNAWTNPDLLACALPGPVSDAPEGIRPILENRNEQYRRDRLPAILNASDVNDPEDLKKDSASCFIRMSTVAVEAFRQAFLDPDSRVRLHSDPPPEPHAGLLAMAWEGGFLRDTAVRFNENLNVLIGGRGAGKSTLVESIRYVLGLDPIGDDAQQAHDSVVRHVLQSGTKVSLLVRSHKPSEGCYTIERSVPNPPVVRDETGEILPLSPREVMPGVEVFGQHEIAELTKSPGKLTLLLERFVDRDPSLSGRKSKLRMAMAQARRRIVDVRRDIQQLDERVAGLPGLEAMQKRFQQAGLEERLKEKSLLIREERLLADLDERLDQYRSLHSQLTEELPVDTAFVSSKALEGLPNADILSEIAAILGTLGTNLEAVGDRFSKALADAKDAIAGTTSRWHTRKTEIEANSERQLRELQTSGIDGGAFVELRQQIEKLRPLGNRMARLRRDLEAHEAQRRRLLAEWEDIKAAEHRLIGEAARRVSRRLRNRVRVRVTMAGNRDPLEQLLREVGGNLAPALKRLRDQDPLSLPELAQRCRAGQEALIERYDLPSGAAGRIAQADPDLFMRIEELDLPATTEIALNTTPDSESATWQTLQALSTGQKATAVLLLLLLESEAPLVVDQPEDDLDNRFITEVVVPIMRREKRRRQFVFSTHNANIPVLGDAELILGIAASGEAGEGHARIAREHMGSIDSAPVRELVGEILEGGKTAFEIRRSRYGF